MSAEREWLAELLEEEQESGRWAASPDADLYGFMADAILAAGYRKVEVVKEWGARFDANGNVYNVHRTLEEAQRFVDSMNEVDAGMSVVVREHTPGTWTAWGPVA